MTSRVQFIRIATNLYIKVIGQGQRHRSITVSVYTVYIVCGWSVLDWKAIMFNYWYRSNYYATLQSTLCVLFNIQKNVIVRRLPGNRLNKFVERGVIVVSMFWNLGVGLSYRKPQKGWGLGRACPSAWRSLRTSCTPWYCGRRWTGRRWLAKILR